MDQIDPGVPGAVDPNLPPPAPGNDVPPADTDPSTPEEKAFARRLGWRPESEFAGAPPSRRPKEFLTAKDYIAKVETEVPIMRDRLRRQDGTIVNLNQKVDETARKVDEAATVIKQMHESQKTIREREYKRARADLEREMDAAARTGDPATYDQAKGKIRALDDDYQGDATSAKPTNGAAEPAAQPPQAARIPEVDAWKALPENRWFDSNIVLNQAAIAYESTIDRTIPLPERLEMMGRWIEKKFGADYPQLFPGYRQPAAEPQPPAEPHVEPPAPPTNPRRAVPSTVAQPAGGGNRQPTGLTYDSLTVDEKTHCDYLVRTVKGFTQEDFLRDYKR